MVRSIVLLIALAAAGGAQAQLLGGGGFWGGSGSDGGSARCGFFCQLLGGNEPDDVGDEGANGPDGGGNPVDGGGDMAGGGGDGDTGGGNYGGDDNDQANNGGGGGVTDGYDAPTNGDYGSPTNITPASQRPTLTVVMDGQQIATSSGANPVFGEHWRAEPPTLRRGDAAGYLIAEADFSNIPANAYSNVTPNQFEDVEDCAQCMEQGCSAEGIVVNEQCACDRSGDGIPYFCAAP